MNKKRWNFNLNFKAKTVTMLTILINMHMPSPFIPFFLIFMYLWHKLNGVFWLITLTPCHLSQLPTSDILRGNCDCIPILHNLWNNKLKQFYIFTLILFTNREGKNYMTFIKIWYLWNLEENLSNLKKRRKLHLNSKAQIYL